MYSEINNSFVNNKDIYYCKADGSYCYIFTATSDYYVSGNMTSVCEQKIKINLLHCHRSYMVNIDKIKDIDKSGKKIILLNNVHIPIAKDRLKYVLKIYLDYLNSKLN